MASSSLHVTVVNQLKQPYPSGHLVKYLQEFWRLLGQKQLLPLDCRKVIELVLVSEKEVAKLNKQFFKRSNATDVLSFPAPAGVEELGSLVLCPEVATRQAERAQIKPEQEMETMASHGLLHLLGYHHH